MIQYSVIVPVYNVENVLEGCIESIVKQTVREIEIILIDDGSTDNSGQICDKFAEKDSRIKVVHIQNGGVSHARNVGIDNSTGIYMVFVDSDDYIDKDYLENLKDHEHDLVVSGYMIERKSHGCEIKKLEENSFYVRETEKICVQFQNGLFNYVWAKRFKVDLIKNKGIRFNEKINLSEDTDFVIRYLNVCTDVGIIGNTNYHYVKYDCNTLSSIKFDVRDIEKIEKVNNILENNLQEILSGDSKQVMEKRMAYFYGDMLLYGILENPDKITLHFLRYLFKQKWFRCFLEKSDEILKEENIKFKHLMRIKSSFIFWIYLSLKKGGKHIKCFVERCIRQLYKIYNLWFKVIKPINVLSTVETIKTIVEENKSVCRFGDGELRMINSEYKIGFQNYNKELSNRLYEVLNCKDDNILICIPGTIYNSEHMTDNAAYFWKEIFFYQRRNIKNMLINRKKQVYGDSLFTRIYMDYKDKTRCSELFNNIKQIWKNKEIVIVEGEKSRLGVGNDLFENVISIERILAPAENAFSCYEKILECCIDNCQNKLVLIALGPTATVLAHDLAKNGIQAIDIGHIDIEYEWYKAKASKKSIVSGKYVNEIAEGRKVSELRDKKYIGEIIEIIKNI